MTNPQRAAFQSEMNNLRKNPTGPLDATANRPLAELARKVGFSVEDDREEGVVKLYLGLG